MVGDRGVVVEESLESIEPVTPDRLELVEQLLRPANGVDVAPHELLAATSALDHEVGSLEDSDVLLHRGEAHVVAASERRDGGVVHHRAPHDVAARAIGKRLEQAIDLLIAQTLYNHTVTC